MKTCINRRNFLQATGAVGAGVGIVGLGGARLLAADMGAGAPNAAKLGWKLGCQAWSFNRFTFYDAIDKTASLGLHYIEAYTSQKISKEHPNLVTNESLPADARTAVKKKLHDSGVKLINYGVCPLYKDTDKSRKVFDFAKDMGIETIVSEPPLDAFDNLDKLCNEYSINVAIHNHPKGRSLYWNPETVLEVCKGRSKRIGACADTGHWERSGLDPLECIKMLKGRIISFHLKDLNEKGPARHDVPWGTGVCDVKGMLAEVHRQGFKGVFSIEYEYNWLNSMPEIAQCVAYFNKVAGELAAGQAVVPARGQRRRRIR